jgi:hypothetical protein
VMLLAYAMRTTAPTYDTDPLLTQEEAAAELRITVRGVETERYNGLLGYIKVAGKVRIPLSAIRAYRERHTICPVPASPHASPRTPRLVSGTSYSTTAPVISGKERALATVRKLKLRCATS